MRLLNADTQPRVLLAPIAEPAVHVFSVGGHEIAFDCNSLRLFQIDGESELDVVSQSGALQKPVFLCHCDLRAHSLVLESCHTCNFGCSYCTLQQYEPGSAVMSTDLAKEAIRMLLGGKAHLSQDSRASLGFFGGEPLCNWKLIEEIVPYFESLCAPKVPKFHITTNGSLLTPERVEFLRKHNFSLIVSLDGPQEVHDACRKYKDGTGTYAAVMQGLQYLHDAGLGSKVTLRSTYSHATADTLLQRVVFLNQLKQQGYASWVSVEPAFLTESLCADSVRAEAEGVTEQDISALAPLYMQVAEWFVAAARSGERPVLHHFTSRLRRLLYCLPYATECGGGVGYVSANGEGKVFACHRETSSYIGDLSLGGIDESLRAKWIDNRIYLRKGCDKCYLRYVCGGGCREHSLGVHGDIRKPVEAECQLQTVLFKCAVWIMTELDLSILTKLIPPPAQLRTFRKRRMTTSIPTQ